MHAVAIAAGIVAASLLDVCLVSQAAAQSGPAVSSTSTAAAVEAAIGYADSSQSAADNAATLGMSARVGLTNRVTVGPDVFTTSNFGDDRLFLLGTVRWDVVPSTGRRVIPYVIAGGGFLRHVHHDVLDGGRRVRYDATVEAGGGVRAYVSKRLYIAPEFRTGSELRVRTSLGVGYRFGKVTAAATARAGTRGVSGERVFRAVDNLGTTRLSTATASQWSRSHDSLLNGILIGAGVGLTVALASFSWTECESGCARVRTATVVRATAVSAGIGGLIDYLRD